MELPQARETSVRSAGWTSIESLKIVLLGFIATILYGIALDQITIRVSPEYFTIAHPPIFHTGSLALIALGWAVISTWWAGIAAGILLAAAARAGSPAKLNWKDLLRPAIALLIIMGALAALLGYVGWRMTINGTISAVQAWGLMLPLDEQARFMAAVFAHATSYFTGAMGTIAIALWALRKRYA